MATSESIFIAASNKAKKILFQNAGKINNIVTYILIIMETVEEYTFLSGQEKEVLTIRVARFFEMANIVLYDDIFIIEIITKLIMASKGKTKLNVKRQSILQKLFCFSPNKKSI